ncbi:MAG: hypothetical protein LBV08_02750, partial [Clostridiales bacterium]|nr:hypothetical protein [Clostridiales bacterium]
MQKKNRDMFYLKKASQGTILSVATIFLLIFLNKSDAYNQLLLCETLPYIKFQKEALFKFDDNKPGTDEENIEAYLHTQSSIAERLYAQNDTPPEIPGPANESSEPYPDDIIGTFNVIFQDDTKEETTEEQDKTENIT